MKSAAVIVAFAGVALAAPQAVTSAIAPPNEATPDGCKTSYDGTFQVSVQAINKKRSISERDESIPLTVKLSNGQMTDSQGRTGYIASNNQFQFDGPVQAGALYTAGWSVCANNSIALGNSAIFYQCLSGTFYNLYDDNDAAQCSPVYLNAVGTAAAATATVNAVKTVACQITDGQVQQNTCLTTVTAAPVITQIGDGQIQAPTGIVTQITDGQVQAPTGVVSQITDGQVQAPTATAPVVSQITDGQVQAPTATPAVQAPTATGAIVSQIGDGQVQAGNGTTAAPASPTPSAASASPSSFTGAAAAPSMKAEIFGAVVGIAALLAL